MPDSTPAPLATRLREEIAQRGPISFREFMERALYDPAGGYYGSGRARVGRGGDFFTNVSVGPLFGRLLAHQFAEMWERLDRPPEFALVEQGSHAGELMCDVLSALQDSAPECFAAVQAWIVEPVPALRRLQEAKLAPFLGQTRWVTDLSELPRFRGIHFSNELIDAFPVHRVVRRNGQWLERGVDLQDEQLVFVDLPITDPALAKRLALLPALPDGYETEVNLAAAEWIHDLAGKIDAGYILAVDYGYPREEYYRPERSSGTLSAYAAHQREPDPLARPGEIDLTAHVDFTSLSEAASAAGLEGVGLSDQHHFIVALGQLHFKTDTSDAKEVRAFKTLMHPNLMGRSFHAIGWQRGITDSRPLSGFRFARPLQS